jgi:uncharacterized protein (TIGR00730 family)
MNTICVFAGSNTGITPAFAEAATALGKCLGNAGINVVYGGGRVGLMGVLADEALSCGVNVTGVIPQALVDREVAHEGLTELIIVDSMHTRKATMARLADAFIALPGGMGTLEELFEVLTWMQLGLHQKPCGVLNVVSYYSSLLDFLDTAVKSGFIREEHRSLLLVKEDANELLGALRQFTSPKVQKWIDESET